MLESNEIRLSWIICLDEGRRSRSLYRDHDNLAAVLDEFPKQFTIVSTVTMTSRTARGKLSLDLYEYIK